MSTYVIAGAGQIGSHLAERLAGGGHEVTVVTRSGSGPKAPGIRRVAADVADAERLAELTKGADALFNCVNPRYWRWQTDWPPMAASMLSAAETSGAVLVILGNLYGYGPHDGPLTEDLPLAATGVKGRVRARMWADALAAHEAGRVRVVEVRGSDYYGPGCLDQSHLGERFIPRLLAGRPALFVGDPDQPHSWTYAPDVARALEIAAVDERAWGRPWHIPTAPAVTARAVAERVSELTGAPAPRIQVLPEWLRRTAGLVSPMMRELGETRYQFDRPYLLDSSAFQATFGMTPTPLDEGLTETIAWWRARETAAA
ncbi:NAD-dependent epimerase/dehydratase family protein [Thermopolyspora sp. NPDC052614]|uniref:NAD-dependent epimerase/dehydratase family protein n=1 Tax=Thermopolyspora sp. NPDC052614 TaxID=3155682 RepID=UPI0034451E7D